MEKPLVSGRWWRSHSVRLRLTMWYVAAMVVVLGVYVFGVYIFVSRNVSDSLDDRLRADFYWASPTRSTIGCAPTSTGPRQRLTKGRMA